MYRCVTLLSESVPEVNAQTVKAVPIYMLE
jgi:hypothetical protein